MYSLFPPLALSSVLYCLPPSMSNNIFSLSSIFHSSSSFCLSHPHLSIFFFIHYFTVISLYLDKLTRIWLFLRAFGLWSSTAIVYLFSTFISGCMIGDPYQLGWLLSTTDRSLSWWMLSCLWWLSYMYARFLISPATCSLILSLDLPSEKRLKIGWSYEQL